MKNFAVARRFGDGTNANSFINPNAVEQIEARLSSYHWTRAEPVNLTVRWLRFVTEDSNDRAEWDQASRNLPLRRLVNRIQINVAELLAIEKIKNQKSEMSSWKP